MISYQKKKKIALLLSIVDNSLATNFFYYSGYPLLAVFVCYPNRIACIHSANNRFIWHNRFSFLTISINVNHVRNEQSVKIVFLPICCMHVYSTHPFILFHRFSRLSHQFKLDSLELNFDRLNIFPLDFFLSSLWLFYLVVTLFDFFHPPHTRTIHPVRCAMFVPLLHPWHYDYHQRYQTICDKKIKISLKIEANSVARRSVYCTEYNQVKEFTNNTHTISRCYKINLMIVVVCTAFQVKNV